LSKTGGSTSQADLLAALQALVLAIPLTPELEAAALARYNALVAALALIPLTPELEAAALARQNALLLLLDAAVSTRATPAQVLTQVQAEVGVASGATLLSLYGIFGNPATTFTAQLARILNIQHTRPYVIEEVEFDDISAVGPTNLSTLSVTPTFPTGATKVKAYLVAKLYASNQTANAQNITPSISAQVNAGGFNSIWAPGDIVVSVPATIGTSAELTAICDISAYFVTAQATDLYFIITQSSANSVHYTSQATIFLVYTV